MKGHWYVAGACSDLGRGLSWQLARSGWPLILADRSPEALSTLADELLAAGLNDPLLVVMDPEQDLEASCQQLSQALSSLPPLSGWVWAGADLKTPAPIAHLSLANWQKGIGQNLTLPLWQLKTALPYLDQKRASCWLGMPAAQPFTHALGASSLLWTHWLTLLAQEFGPAAPRLLGWQLPRLADRVQRRIWPLAELDSFSSIDDAIERWMSVGWQAPLRSGDVWQDPVA